MTRVLVLCSHEPERDPRIHWIAGFAPDGVECTVVGFHDPSRPRSARESLDRYSIVRLAPSQASWYRDLGYVGGILLRHADAWTKSKLFLGFAIALPFLAACVIVTFVIAVVSRISGRLRRLMGSGADSAGGSDPGMLRKGWRALRRFWQRGLERPLVRRFFGFQWLAMHVVRVSAVLLKHARTAGPFDVVHANDFDTLVAGTALKLMNGWRLVYDAHEYWPHSDVGSTHLERVSWAAAEGFFARFADAAFTVSAPLALDMERAYGRPFGVLPNCEPYVADPTVPESAERNARLSVVYLGTFAPERGIEEVIRAWGSQDIGEAALYLHGPDNECKSACVAIARASGTFGRTVHFPPPVHETEMVNIASRYDVGLIPYKPITIAYRFCCPNKLSQYMQAGLAILTNDLPNVANLVRHYDCGVVYDASQAETLAGAVRRLAANGGPLPVLRQHSANAARTEFNWQAQSRVLYAAYTEKTSDAKR